jgi:dolichol-phosphate mannosyltransferase
MKKSLISVVVPVFNEEEAVGRFLDEQLMPTLDKIDEDFEIVVVDDGSKDKSVEKVKSAKINEKYPVRIISFVRNFGKESALSAGIKYAKGDAVIMIDADGQHPVNVIPLMIEKWQNGAKVVTAMRGHNTTKHRLASKMYYGMMKMLGNKNIVVGALDFRLIDRAVANDFNVFTERNRMTRGLIDWLGYPQVFIKVKTLNRINGKPTYSFRKLIGLAVDSLASSSRTPLVIFGYIGAFITIFSLLFGIFILIQQYILGDPLHLDWSGAVAMSVFVSFLVGLVLVSQSMTALYISQIHVESKGRPLYIIDDEKSVGVNDESR